MNHTSARCATALTQHRLVLAGHAVTYRLCRARRRLSLRIDEQGLLLGAPPHLSLALIEAFIARHADWVLARLAALSQDLARRRAVLVEGAQLPLLGGVVTLRFTSGANHGFFSENELWLALRAGSDPLPIARRALQRRALEYFEPRVASQAARLCRAPPPLALSSARRRWGSCNAQGVIRLNWRLIHLPPAAIDYVIAHEVAHLVEMNHGPRFWQLVTRLQPDWRAARALLDQSGRALPII